MIKNSINVWEKVVARYDPPPTEMLSGGSSPPTAFSKVGNYDIIEFPLSFEHFVCWYSLKCCGTWQSYKLHCKKFTEESILLHILGGQYAGLWVGVQFKPIDSVASLWRTLSNGCSVSWTYGDICKVLNNHPENPTQLVNREKRRNYCERRFWIPR